MSFISNLDTPLLALSPRDNFTLRDAVTGVHIFGGIGSGKTSGSGQTLAAAYLRAGMGGLVLCAKPEEVPLWLGYARKHGRSKSVVVFDETRGFNFIDHELARQGHKGISNVTECVMRVLESADQTTGTTGAASDPFWPQSTRQVLGHAIPVLYAAHGKVTVAGIIDFVVSAATKADQYIDQEWANDSFAARTLRKAADDPVFPMEQRTERAMFEYWFHEWPEIPEKTRGNIRISLSARLDRFRHGRLRDCFCGKTDIVPEMAFHGAIILMSMPALTWNEGGIIGQQLMKYMFQRAVESRNGLEASQQQRPVFLWADEAQYFLSVKDDEFLSTCRAPRACVVFLSQTLPSYYARLGKDKTDAADGLVGKFATQVFHQNADNRTNEYASKLIGRTLQRRRSESYGKGTNRSRGMNAGANTSGGTSSSSGGSYGGQQSSSNYSVGSNRSSGNSWGDNVGEGSSENWSTGSSEQMDNRIEPRFFASELLSGGPANRHRVTAVWFKAGGDFKEGDGGNFLIPTFTQRP